MGILYYYYYNYALFSILIQRQVSKFLYFICALLISSLFQRSTYDISIIVRNSYKSDSKS